MMNNGYRSTNIPDEIQTEIDAANARADQAEAQVRSLSERLKRRSNSSRRVLVYGIFLGILLKGASLEYLSGFHASVRNFFRMLTSATVVWDQEPSTPITTSPASNPPTPQIRSTAWNAQLGMIRVDPVNCRTGQPYSWIDTPDPQQTGFRVYDGVSSRPVQGCGPSSGGVTMRIKELDVRLDSVDRTLSRYGTCTL